jgi:2,3-bisphosphoglycerate-dependent phosphoglycerate mutase
MHKLVLIRHGESVWNKENRFTGWQDVELSELGRAEALEAGKTLLKSNFEFDLAFCSLLKRANHTLWSIQEQMDTTWLPVVKSWRLNERHYGSLTGLNKSETAARHGEEQVKIWRRSFDTPPPLLEEGDARHPKFDRRYAQVPVAELPLGESLKMTVARVLPFWNSDIKPAILAQKKVLIAAHGNSLRALVMHLENLTSDGRALGLRAG